MSYAYLFKYIIIGDTGQCEIFSLLFLKFWLLSFCNIDENIINICSMLPTGIVVKSYHFFLM